MTATISSTSPTAATRHDAKKMKRSGASAQRPEVSACIKHRSLGPPRRQLVSKTHAVLKKYAIERTISAVGTRRRVTGRIQLRGATVLAVLFLSSRVVLRASRCARRNCCFWSVGGAQIDRRAVAASTLDARDEASSARGGRAGAAGPSPRRVRAGRARRRFLGAERREAPMGALRVVHGRRGVPVGRSSWDG